MSDLPPPATPPQPQAYEPPQAAPVPPSAPPSYPAAPVAPPVYPPVQAAPTSPVGADGVARGTFTSRKAANRVLLEVDGVFYECSTTAPTDPLIAAIEAQETGNNWALMSALRQLVPAVMLPEARVRYEARLRGATDEGGPIDPTEFLAHGLWLVGVYFASPTAGSAPSGAGPATPQ